MYQIQLVIHVPIHFYKHNHFFLFRNMEDKLGEAKSSGNLGNTLKVMGKYDEAMVCCKRHLEISRQLNDKLSEGNFFNFLILFVVSICMLLKTSRKLNDKLSEDYFLNFLIFFVESICILIKTSRNIHTGQSMTNRVKVIFSTSSFYFLKIFAYDFKCWYKPWPVSHLTHRSYKLKC